MFAEDLLDRVSILDGGLVEDEILV